MLKYLFQQNHQTASWADTIIKQPLNISKKITNGKIKSGINTNVYNAVNNKEFLDICYLKARKEASQETKMNIDIFPVERPNDWALNNILNQEFIYNFLVQNAYTNEVKRYLENKYNI